MGLIFDIHSAMLYESWYHSPRGKAMDSFVERIIHDLLKPQKSESILDIGCGTGNHLMHLNRLGLDISGIDASPYMIDQARKRLGDRCTLKTGMAEDLPFDDNEFDLAIMINTLEFLDSPLKALREAGRVTRRKILIGVMNSFSWTCVYHKIKGLFRDTIYKYIKTYNLWEIKGHAQAAFGIVPIEWRTEQFLPFKLERINPLPSSTNELGSWPFGSFLGLAATINYRLKTDNLPLKMRIKKTEQAVTGGITPIGDHNAFSEGNGK